MRDRNRSRVLSAKVFVSVICPTPATSIGGVRSSQLTTRTRSPKFSEGSEGGRVLPSKKAISGFLASFGEVPDSIDVESASCAKEAKSEELASFVVGLAFFEGSSHSQVLPAPKPWRID